MYFSVIIPLYNKKDDIKKSIDSVLLQSYKNFEIVVLNDGSTDGCELIVEQMMANDNRIRLINRENGGVSVARNSAVSEAKYDYICLLDADDEWTTDFLQVMFEMITEFPDHKIFSVRHEIVEKDGRVILPTVGLPEDFRGEVKNFIKLYTHHDGLVNSSSICLEKKYFQSLGGFPDNQGNGEDIYLWLLYGMKTTLVFTNQVCSRYYRNRENSSTGRMVHMKLPFQFDYFLNYEKNDQTQDLKKYLRKSALLHIAGLKLFNQTTTAFKHSLKLFKHGKLTGLLCLSVAVMPNFVLKAVKSSRDHMRSKN